LQIKTDVLKVRQFVTLDFSYLLFLNELQNKHFLSLLKSYFFEGFIVTKRMLSNPRRRKKYGAKQLSKHKRKNITVFAKVSGIFFLIISCLCC
jgi:hypothetical protein